MYSLPSKGKIFNQFVKFFIKDVDRGFDSSIGLLGDVDRHAVCRYIRCRIAVVSVENTLDQLPIPSIVPRLVIFALIIISLNLSFTDLDN